MSDQANNEAQSGLLKNSYVQSGLSESLARKREKMTENSKNKFTTPIDNAGREKDEDS